MAEGEDDELLGVFVSLPSLNPSTGDVVAFVLTLCFLLVAAEFLQCCMISSRKCECGVCAGDLPSMAFSVSRPSCFTRAGNEEVLWRVGGVFRLQDNSSSETREEEGVPSCLALIFGGVSITGDCTKVNALRSRLDRKRLHSNEKPYTTIN